MQPDAIRYLTFQGGSVKGIAYLGAYQALLDVGVTIDQLEGIAGTSAGAITALLLALHYSIDEAQTVFDTLDFKTFLDQDRADVRSLLFEIKDKHGLTLFGDLVSQTSRSTPSKASMLLAQTFGLFEGEV